MCGIISCLPRESIEFLPRKSQRTMCWRAGFGVINIFSVIKGVAPLKMLYRRDKVHCFLSQGICITVDLRSSLT